VKRELVSCKETVTGPLWDTKWKAVHAWLVGQFGCVVQYVWGPMYRRTQVENKTLMNSLAPVSPGTRSDLLSVAIYLLKDKPPPGAFCTSVALLHVLLARQHVLNSSVF
jgi:hypothetical protein